jgi:hypothetical protein
VVYFIVPPDLFPFRALLQPFHNKEVVIFEGDDSGLKRAPEEVQVSTISLEEKMNKRLTVVFFVVLVLIISGLAFAQQSADLNSPVPIGEKGEAPKYAPQRVGNTFLGRPSNQEGPLSEGFEGGAIPASWTVYNEDGDGYQWEAYSTTSAHSGSYVARVHYNYTAPGCDDWLITPKLTCGTSETLTFWAKSYSSYYLEDFEVRVSTTGNAVGDFTNLELTVIGQPYDWTEYNIDLSAYDGMDIYVAVRCISYDEFYLYVDDFSGPDLWVPTDPVIAFNTTDLAFGTVPIGMSADQSLVMYNVGGAALTVSSVVSDNAHFTHDFSGPVVIAPGDSSEVTVTFTPDAEPEETGNLTVTHDGVKATSIITMSGSGNVPVGLPFTEDFESGFLPPGWTQYLQGSPYSYGWVWASGGAPDFTGYCAAHFYDYYYYCDDWLVTPLITIPVGYEGQLDFWQYQYWGSWMDYHGIWVSTGSSNPSSGDFVEVASLGPGTDGAWEPAPTIDLTAYTGVSIYIAFVYRGIDADDWAIDDVYFGEYVNQPPEIAHDPKGDTDDTTPTITAIITDVESFTATAYYETAAKVFASMAMSPGVLPDEYYVDLPAMPYGTVNYYIEADDGAGGVATTDTYSFEIQEFVGWELFYDDGTVENAHVWNPGYTDGRWAVRFTPPAYPCTLTAVKLGIINGWPDDIHQQFGVEVYDDDGAGGAPGTLIYGPDITGSVGNVVGGLPPLSGPPYPLNWAYVCITDEVIISSGDFYVAKVQLEGNPDCEGLEEDEDGVIAGRSWERDPTYLTWSQLTDRNSMIRAYTKQVLAYGDLAGKVTDIDTGDPIQGAAVTADGAMTASDITDVNGDYLIEDLLAGDYDVSVCAPGYFSETATDVAVLEDQTTTQDFPLTSCGALLCEGFEGDFPPCLWASYELGDPAGWQQDDYQVYSGDFSAFHNDDNVTTGCNDYLVTPPIAVPSPYGAQLEFMQYQNYSSWYEYHGIHVSTGSGNPNEKAFVELLELGAGTEDTWEAVGPIDLSAYAGQTIYLAFVYQGDYADEWWIDDVLVTEILPLHLSDGGVDPFVGNLATDYTYSVTYTHDEDLAPTVQDVYIDGAAFAMTDPTGGAGPYTGGVVFTYVHKFPLGGNHEFYFKFEDGTNAVRLPKSGAFKGPTNGYYFYDFEDAAHFTSTGPNDLWEWGIPTDADGPASAHSGENCWGINLDGDYDYYTAARLMTPPMDFTTGGLTKLELKFWSWYDTEYYYDGGNVKLITPTDTVIIYPDTTQCPDYDEDAIYSYNGFIPGEPAYSGHDQQVWEEAIFDLTPWTNESNVVIAWDFGSNGSVQYPGWFIDDVVIWGQWPLADRVAFDIKPGSCPNPLNVNDQGVTPVAILGTADFDVTQVDAASMMLEGVAPAMWAYEDVSTPVAPGGGLCECTTAGPDGFMDLTLKYDTPELAMALYPVVDQQTRVLTIRGTMVDGAPIMGQDCVRIIWKRRNPKFPSAITHADFGRITSTLGTYPNPFNAETSIFFGLPERTPVSLVIYNVLGEKVRTLVNEEMDAGYHTVYWNGRDETGGLVASGIYFYRFESNLLTKTQKMVMLR